MTVALQVRVVGLEGRGRVRAINLDTSITPEMPTMRVPLNGILVLLTCLTSAAMSAQAQPPAPRCSLTTDELRPIVLRNGSLGMIFPVEMLANGDSVLILGLGATVDSAGKPIPLVGDDSSIVGFLLTSNRRVATSIPAPHDMPTARYFRTRATTRGWESVFFVPDRDTVVGARFLDSGTLWYARLTGRRWSDLERIAHVENSVVVRPASSDLIARNGVLYFAVGYGDPGLMKTAGGLMIYRRSRANRWTVDTIPMQGPALSFTTPAENASLKETYFFPVTGIWEGADFFPGSMLAVNAAQPNRWSIVRRAALESMNDPVEVVSGDTMYTTWWEEGRGGMRASSWYQALDPRRENDASNRRLLVEGITRFKFLGMPEDGRIRPVWVYQAPSSSDSAEIAVVANGEPVAIGRIAFPYAFLTNGVASGDRSLILATMPRLTPGEGPPVSRTLEVRVDCRGAIDTSTGGTHEARVDGAGVRRSAGNRRLHR